MPSFNLDHVRIPLSQVKDGQSDFTIDLKMDPQEVADGRFAVDHLDINANVTLLGDDILVRLRISTKADSVCDRCGEDSHCLIQGEVATLFTSDPRKLEGAEGGEVRLFDVRTMELEITQEVIDALFLSIPEKVVCSESCRGLCPHCGTNLNESACQCSNDPIDPRWDALKNIKLD